MEKNCSAAEPTVPGLQGADPVGSGRSSNPAINLLLVSRSATWARAVERAKEEIGGGELFTCGARDAVARLASISSRYSHLLVDGNDADGLLNELVDLTTEIAGPDTDMLMLGAAAAGRPRMRVIPVADPRSVRDALMSSPPSPARSRTAIDLADLRAALDGAMIETRYQPMIRMSDRQPIGLEALARLNHPVTGILLPDQFVPQVEAAGLAWQLTELVCALALADSGSGPLSGSGLRMSVNFPLDVLLAPTSLERLEEQRTASGIAADRIIIELTESRPVEDVVSLRRSLERLRGLGYGAAIDDVGPAVPRLAPLLELPFTSLKLDKSQVQRVIDTPDIHRFLATTIEQAKKRGLTVVAEGVETEEIWARMLAMGADEAQGFLAARPLPVAAVSIWLHAWMAATVRPHPDRGTSGRV